MEVDMWRREEGHLIDASRLEGASRVSRSRPVSLASGKVEVDGYTVQGDRLKMHANAIQHP